MDPFAPVEPYELQPQIESLGARLQDLTAHFDEIAEPDVLTSVARVSAAIEELEVAAEELQVRTEEQKARHEELEFEARRYRDLFSFAPDGYLVTDVEGIIIDANMAATELLGTRLRLLLGQPILVFADDDGRLKLLDSLRSAVRERAGSPVDVEMRMAPPGTLPFFATLRLSAAPAAAGRQLVRWIIRDTNLKVRAECALADSEARYRLLADNASDVVLTVDSSGRISYASPSSWSVLAWEPDFLSGENLLSLIHPGDRAAVEQAEREASVSGQATTLTCRARRGNGRYGPVEVCIGPLVNREGSSVGLRAALRDVREREEARTALEAALVREREISAALRHADTVKNTLLLAVSHDLRNPAAAASGMAEILLDRYEVLSRDDVQRIAEGLAFSTAQINDILSNLLDVERLEAGQVAVQGRPTELTEIIAASAKSAGLVGDLVDLPTEPVMAKVDPGLTSRIIENLFTNAARYAPRGSTVRVGIARTDKGLLLNIDNEGPPVPDHAKETIFEAFWRQPGTAGGGLGLGLYLVRRFAEIQNGRVWVEDTREGGCSFKVLLPAADPSPPSTAPDDQQGTPPATGSPESTSALARRAGATARGSARDPVTEQAGATQEKTARRGT